MKRWSCSVGSNRHPGVLPRNPANHQRVISCALPQLSVKAIPLTVRHRTMFLDPAKGPVQASESVRGLRQGLHSFRNMRRMEASLRKARALRLRFSQSLASRRQRFNQAFTARCLTQFFWNAFSIFVGTASSFWDIHKSRFDERDVKTESWSNH